MGLLREGATAALHNDACCEAARPHTLGDVLAAHLQRSNNNANLLNMLQALMTSCMKQCFMARALQQPTHQTTRRFPATPCNRQRPAPQPHYTTQANTHNSTIPHHNTPAATGSRPQTRRPRRWCPPACRQARGSPAQIDRDAAEPEGRGQGLGATSTGGMHFPSNMHTQPVSLTNHSSLVAPTGNLRMRPCRATTVGSAPWVMTTVRGRTPLALPKRDICEPREGSACCPMSS